jgi:hypothetical protein
VAEEGREDGSSGSTGESFKRTAATLTPLGALLAFIYTMANDRGPQSPWGIVLAASIIAVLFTVFVLALNHQLAEERGKTVMAGGLSYLLLCVLTLALSAGILTAVADSAEEADTPVGSSRYAGHVRQEIHKLESAGGLVTTGVETSRQAYAQRAREIAVVYEEVVSGLRRLDVADGRRTAHRQLVHSIAAVGRAYQHLATVALERSATKSEVDTARSRVRKAVGAIDTAERELE